MADGEEAANPAYPLNLATIVVTFRPSSGIEKRTERAMMRSCDLLVSFNVYSTALLGFSTECQAGGNR